MKILLFILFLLSSTWAVYLQFRNTVELRDGVEYVWKLDNIERVTVKPGRSIIDPEKEILDVRFFVQEQIEGLTERWVNNHQIGYVTISKNEIRSKYSLDYWRDNDRFASKVDSLTTIINGDRLALQLRHVHTDEGILTFYDNTGDSFPDIKIFSNDGIPDVFSIEYTLHSWKSKQPKDDKEEETEFKDD